jgi:FMN phosphatase YigB (HAD superfamily)
MFRTAARDLRLDLTRSSLIGNRWTDIAAAGTLGAHGILVPTAETPPEEVERARAEMAVAPTLGEAAARILGLTARAPER